LQYLTSSIKHNSIPAPHEGDNVRFWKPDFNQNHYQDLLFDDTPGSISMTNYFLEQSSGKYKVTGVVEDWVSAPKEMAYYGSNEPCGSDCNVWEFICGTADAWYDAKINEGWSLGAITDYLSQFDQQDRYDWNENGVFAEPDGYIDQ
jgi:immune inhibitor A